MAARAEFDEPEQDRPVAQDLPEHLEARRIRPEARRQDPQLIGRGDRRDEQPVDRKDQQGAHEDDAGIEDEAVAGTGSHGRDLMDGISWQPHIVSGARPIIRRLAMTQMTRVTTPMAEA